MKPVQNETCGTCNYYWPIWTNRSKICWCCLDTSHVKLVSANDTCSDWKAAFDESITGTSFNKD